MNAITVILIVAAIVALLVWLVYASASISSGVYVHTLCRAKTDKPVIALTFDDSPHPQQTPLILDILKEYNIKATFFAIGANIEQYPDIAARIVNEGHILGNHSYAHTSNFPLFSPDKMRDDVARCEALIERITPPEQRYKLFRPPFGVTNPTIGKVVKEGGYTTIGWNIRSLDTVRPPLEAWQRIVKRIRPGSVILLHDRMPESHILLEKLIRWINNEGYQIVNINELFDLKPQQV